MASVLGVAQRTYASYERNERLPDAEALEALVRHEGVDANWLLTGQGPERTGGDGRVAEAHSPYVTASQDLSADHLTIALELADEALRGLWLPRRGYAELVALVYAALTQGLPYAEILEIARPAARQRAGEGAGDGGEQGMDGPGPSGVGRGAAA